MKNFGRFSNELWQTFKQTFTAFGEMDPFNKSVVIAYYTIFSLPGLLVRVKWIT